MNQLDIFESSRLRDKGMARAEENAGRSWNDMAYNYLFGYIKTHKEFMTEDVRVASNLPEPPSQRAWGSVVVRAKRNGLIVRNGYEMVKNPKAHRTPATLWRVV